MSESGLEKFILDKLDKLDDKLDQVRDESVKLTAALLSHENKDEEIHSDVRKMSDRFCSQLDAQYKELQKYNKHLEDHMRRSDILEASHHQMWKRVKPVVEAHEENRIIDRWLSKKVRSRLKWITIIGTAAGSLTAILKFMNMI